MKIKNIIFLLLVLGVFIVAACEKDVVGRRAPPNPLTQVNTYMPQLSSAQKAEIMTSVYNNLANADKTKVKNVVCGASETTPTTQPPAGTSTLAIEATPVTSVARSTKEGGLDLYATVTSNKPIQSVVVQSHALRNNVALDTFRARGTSNIGNNQYNTGLPVGSLQCNDVYEYYWQAQDSVKTVTSPTYRATITC